MYILFQRIYSLVSLVSEAHDRYEHEDIFRVSLPTQARLRVPTKESHDGN